MQWLITGGCGFIGTNLIRHLVGEGVHGIRVFDDLSVGRTEDLATAAPGFVSIRLPGAFPAPGGPAQLFVGDIADTDALDEAARSADIVVHLAASTGVVQSVADPRSDCMANVVGTLNALEAARRQGVGRFVFASSGAVLGEQTPPLHEELVARPLSPYGASKLAGEAYCSVYASCFGIKTAALRFANVYGPGSALKGSVVAKFIRQALRGERLVVYGDGGQTRDFVYIDDLVDAVCRAAALPRGGEIFQIATSRETTIREIADSVADLIREATGIAIGVDYAESRTGEIRRNFADAAKADRLLGWQPRHSLRDGLRHTVRWYVERQLSGGGE